MNKPILITIVIVSLIAIAQGTGIIKFAGFEESSSTSKSNLDSAVVPVEQLIIPSPNPTITPTPKPVKPVYVDPNPIIDCNIHANCGGGTRKMKRSECDQSICCNISPSCGGGARITTKSKCEQETCCQIGGKWSMYPTAVKCQQDQEAYWKDYYSKNNAYLPSINTNEVACDVVGYSQSRNVWTTILTPQECDIARANNTSVKPTSYPPCTIYYPLNNFSSTFYYMSPEECKTAQDKANSNSVQNSNSTQDYDSAVSACLNRMRAAGIANSSVAQQCYNNPNLGL